MANEDRRGSRREGEHLVARKAAGKVDRASSGGREMTDDDYRHDVSG
jgi:hypothetical protein